MRRVDSLVQLLAPVALVGVAAFVGTIVSTSTETYVINALVNVAIVVALYVFIGNFGVLSFGHISFVAIGAWAAGVLSMPVEEKPAIMPNLASVLRDHTIGNVWSLESLRRWLREAGDERIETVQKYVKILPEHLVRRFIAKKGDAETGRRAQYAIGVIETT